MWPLIKTWLINVSVNSKPAHPPSKTPGKFFDGRIPHPSGKKGVQNPHPSGLSKPAKTPPPGHFFSIIHYKNTKKWDRNHVKLQDFIIFRWLKNKLGLQLLSPRLH